MREEKGYWQKRLRRRRLLANAALGGMGLGGAGILGCAGDRAPPPDRASPGTAPAPKRGGELVRAGGSGQSFDVEGAILDPHRQSVSRTRGQRFFYQGLLAYDFRTFEAEPELAQRWEQPSPTEYIFHLQPGVRWHDKPPVNGRELTTSDIVFSINRVMTNDPRFVHRSLLVTVAKVEATNQSTIKVTTKEPDAVLLSRLASDGTLVLAPEAVEKADEFATADEAIGTGAFIIKSVEEKVAAEYVRNPNYWKAGRPYLDKVVIRYFPDEEVSYAAFLAGRVHVSNVPAPEGSRYIAAQGPNYIPDWAANPTIHFATPNLKSKPMDDGRVTRALRLLIDHEEFRTSWARTHGGRGRHGSVLPSTLEAWDLTEEEYKKLIFWQQPKDAAVREALALLAAAGFTRDNPVKLEFAYQGTGSISAAAEMQDAQWRRLGQGVVQPQLKNVPTGQLPRIRATRAFAYLLQGASAGADDPDPWFTQNYRSGGSLNYMGLEDPRLDALIDRQRGLFNLSERRAVVREVMSYMAENSPGITNILTTPLRAVNPKVRGYIPEFFVNGRQYEWIWLDV